MSRSNYIKPLLSSKKSGPHLVTISNVTKYKSTSGEEIKRNGKVGVVVTFKNDEIEHEELYWIGGYNYSKLLALLTMLDVEILLADDKVLKFNTIGLAGKNLWIVIRHNITIENGRETKRESELTDYSTEDKKPNAPPIIEEYDIAAVK